MIVAKKSKKKVEGKQEQHFDSEKVFLRLRSLSQVK